MTHRRSHKRDRILQFLEGTTSHPTADAIYGALKDEMPDLSLGTVYRNLNVLKEQGLVRDLPMDGGVDRYEADIAPHHHLICDSCGAIIDFQVSHPAPIDEIVQKQTSFKISRHRIDFFGICDKCQKTTQPPRRKGK